MELYSSEVLCVSGDVLSTESGPGLEDKPTIPWKIPITGRNRYSQASGSFAKKLHVSDPASLVMLEGKGLACRFI